MAKTAVRLLSSMGNHDQVWAPGDLFECPSEEEAQSMIEAGVAVPIDPVPEEGKPRKARKGE